MFSFIRKLPVALQINLVFLVVAAVVGMWALFNWTVALSTLGGLLLLGLLLALFFYWRRRRREWQAEAFGGELNQQSSLTPRGISDPARQARLDDLRKSFNAGVAKFKAVGKNLYQLPWYMIIGEPGAGKTEAIRHSGVGFPPGMQDELQGVGGTINMNWWFTNQAVILDTAGRLMFEEVEPGTTNEWREFLGLLKKYRPNCPVNGIFLTLPADSLIRDEPAEIQRKAGRIARQMEVIQKQFDLRFPVFVLITKCDLLNGFREFFDGLDDPAAANQMIGWSNPDPLDAPFRPEVVDAHLETSLAKLRRRRLALLADPVARAGAQSSRLDETDRLFALPQSLALVAPRLRRYLEIIFTVGEWSAKPLFLRGIYFTSSLREGSALDQELAEAIGVPVDNLPEGRAWEREETRFLRDVFLEKAFKERGLVTRASNTKRLLRRRQFAVFGAGFAALLLLGLLSFLGYRSLRQSIGRLGGYWLRAAEGWNRDDTWQPVVTPGGGGGKPAAYVGDQPVGPGEQDATRLLYRGGNESVVSFHGNLQAVAGTPVSVPWVFRPLVGLGLGPAAERHSAQRVVFEASVVKPLLDATRERMGGPELPAGVTAETEDNAFLALVRLEAAILKHVPIENDGGETWTNRYFGPMLTYATGKVRGEDTRPLANVAAWTYSPDGSREAWAPAYLSGGANLPANTALAAALNRLGERAKSAVDDQNRRLSILKELADVAKQFRDRENELFTAVTARGQTPEATDRAVFELTGIRGDLAPPAGTLKDRRLTLDRKIAELGGVDSFFDENASLRAGYERGAKEVKRQTELVKTLLAECEPFAPKKLNTDLARQANLVSSRNAKLAQAAADAFSTASQSVLFNVLAERLRALLPALENAAAAGKPDDATFNEWRALDEGFLANSGDGRRLYAWRFDAYEGADRVAPGRNYAQSLPLLGSEWRALKEIFDKTAAIRTQINAYDKPLKDRLTGIVGYNLGRVERFHSGEFPAAYLTQLKTKLRTTARYPLTYPPGGDAEVLSREELRAVGLVARQLETDLKAPVYVNLPPASKTALAAYVARLGPWQALVNAITNADGSPAAVTVTLLNGNTQRQLGGALSALDVFGGVELRDGTIRHGGRAAGSDVAGRTSTNSPVDLRLGKFPVLEPFHFHFFRGATDANVAVDLPCGENYTAVRLANGLLGGVGARAEGDGWIVPVRPDAQRTLWVRVNFPKPLPAVGDWPTRGALELGD